MQLTVGVKNLGPEPTSGSPKRLFGVELPAGTELADHPEAICPPVTATFPFPHPRRFNCGVNVLRPGESRLVTFNVRITGRITGMGRIETVTFGLPFDPDTNVGNNAAAITITAGELAQTGTDAKMIAAIGSGAVVVGGLLLLVLRRFGLRRG